MLWYLVIIAATLCFLHILLNCTARARCIRKIPGLKERFIFGDTIELMTHSSVGLMKLRQDLAEKNKGIYRLWTFPYGAVNIYNPKDIEIVISSVKFNEKSEIYKILRPWLRDGLLLSKGSKWQERRKILTPAFHFNILRQFGQIIEENSHRLVTALSSVAGSPVDVVPIVSEFTLNSICVNDFKSDTYKINAGHGWHIGSVLFNLFINNITQYFLRSSSCYKYADFLKFCRTIESNLAFVPETAMGTQLQEHLAAKSYKDAIHDMGFIFFQRFSKIYYLFDFIFNLSRLGYKQRRYLDTVQGFTKNVIDERKVQMDKYGFKIEDHNKENKENVYSKKKTALLDLLLSAEKEGLIDSAGIQEEVDTFMFEGHDTTASGLTFCFMILANNKDAQDKIFEELTVIFGDSNCPITMEDLSKMKYLERCVKEALRLYPPVHFISRNLKEKVTLSDYEIPADTFCHVHIYDLHRRPDIFENPNKFDPDRFLPENSVGRHPYAYIPFSAGPRNCIGQKFAMIEMKLAVAQVLREFELKPVTRPSDLRFVTDLILRNDGPVEVIFVKRQNTNTNDISICREHESVNTT